MGNLDTIARDFEAFHAVGLRMARAYIDGGPSAGIPLMHQFDPYAERINADLAALVRQQSAELERSMAMVKDMCASIEKESEFTSKANILAGIAIALVAGLLGIFYFLGTEQKKADENLKHSVSLLQATVESTADGILAVDNEGTILTYNHNFVEMWGIPDSIMEPRDHYIARKFIAGQLADQKGFLDSTREYYLNPDVASCAILDLEDGRTHECCAMPQRLGGKIVGRVYSFRDLTPHKKAQAELRQAQASLLQSEKMAAVGQLAAGIAHEINNPMGFINSNLGTLGEYQWDLSRLLEKYLALEKQLMESGEENVSEKVGALCAEIAFLRKEINFDYIMGDFEKVISESLDGCQRVKSIILDLKDFSHVENSELQEADINKCLESTLNIVWNELKYKVTVNKGYQTLPLLRCLPRQLNQVFLNLFVNAAQAIEDRGTMAIRTGYHEAPEPHIEVQISDTGKGIAKENLSKIFEPFFTTKPVGSGTGLGLHMAYGIVKRHRGEILVESEEGKGTTFTIKLPIGEVMQGAA
ncbi:MAG: ATP-binding protein [Pseudomonadota bacterium]